jgi:chromate reductase, NAD(P)H dehydrogenase (quinone)
MITIVAGTNRVGSNSKKVATQYQELLSNMGQESQVLALEDVEMFKRNEAFVEIENQFLRTEKIIFILPEYNGTFPGIVKLMIDNTDVKTVWPNKKIAMTGISSGRAGNLRGMDHLATAFMYLKSTIYHDRLPISGIEANMTEGKITNEGTLKSIQNQLEGFLKF